MSDIIVKVSWSGGKDSTCAVSEHIKLGHKVKAVCYIPMFTEEIPLISKAHYEFILRTADKFRAMGAEVHIVTGETYFHYVLRRSSRGKFKGRMFGFPHFARGQCGFKRDSKLKALANLDIGYYDYEDIGIAADEVDRHAQLSDKKRSILCELGITEDDALVRCLDRDILSPHYDYNERDGCSLCPNAKIAERERWFRDYPEAIPLVLYLQQEVKQHRPNLFPLRDHKWFMANDHGDPLTRSEWLDQLLQ